MVGYERHVNWKVLLENYCENYHTPFIHSQLPVAGYEYPIECAGDIIFAWDRPLEPRDRSEQARHDHRPGTPGWADVADVAAADSFNNGSYLALFPSTAVSCFAVFAATFRLQARRAPSSSTSGTRRCLPSGGPPTSPRPRKVAAQDLAICEALQGTYDAGLSADGVLSTVHESGVAHVHQLLLAALAGAG